MFLEVGEEVGPAPAGVAHGFPTVVVAFGAADVHQVVDGARST